MSFVNIQNEVEISCYNTEENMEIVDKKVAEYIEQGFQVKSNEVFLFFDNEKRKVVLAKRRIE